MCLSSYLVFIYMISQFFSHVQGFNLPLSSWSLLWNFAGQIFPQS